jgi:hypothetical protein
MDAACSSRYFALGPPIPFDPLEISKEPRWYKVRNVPGKLTSLPPRTRGLGSRWRVTKRVLSNPCVARYKVGDAICLNFMHK